MNYCRAKCSNNFTDLWGDEIDNDDSAVYECLSSELCDECLKARALIVADDKLSAEEAGSRDLM